MEKPDNNCTSTIMFIKSSSKQSSELAQKILELEKAVQIKYNKLKSNKALIETASQQIQDTKKLLASIDKIKCVRKQEQKYIEYSQLLLNLNEQLNSLNLNQLVLAIEYERIKNQLQYLNSYHIEVF